MERRDYDVTKENHNMVNQPKHFTFPKRSFGQQKTVRRCIQSSGFSSNPWLHYDEARDLAFCHVCMTAQRDGRLSSSTVHKAFIVTGFSNWKDATIRLKNHESCLLISLLPGSFCALILRLIQLSASSSRGTARFGRTTF